MYRSKKIKILIESKVLEGQDGHYILSVCITVKYLVNYLSICFFLYYYGLPNEGHRTWNHSLVNLNGNIVLGRERVQERKAEWEMRVKS